MRKITLTILVLFPILLFSQNQSYKFLTAGGGFNFGLKNAGEFEFVSELLNYKGKKFSNGMAFSLGVLLPMENGFAGENYNGIIAEVDRDDLGSVGIEKSTGFYAGVGYTYKRISILVKAGSYSDIYFENGYNSIMGLHYITRSGNEYIVYGGSVNIKANKWLSFTGGYNNYSNYNFGINFRYSKF